MFKTNGNNQFKNNTFNWYSWAADVLQTPDEVRATFDQLKIAGRKITGIRAIGMAYDLRDELIEEYIYRASKELGKEEANVTDAEVVINQCAEIDEPMILFLDDGSRFEIEYSEASCVQMSKNAIPADIIAGTNINNFDASKLFACCIGTTILDLEIKLTDKYPNDFTGSHFVELPEGQAQYITKIALLLSNGFRLCFSNLYDYGEVWVENAAGELRKITLDKVKKTLIPEQE